MVWNACVKVIAVSLFDDHLFGAMAKLHCAFEDIEYLLPLVLKDRCFPGIEWMDKDVGIQSTIKEVRRQGLIAITV